RATRRAQFRAVLTRAPCLISRLQPHAGSELRLNAQELGPRLCGIPRLFRRVTVKISVLIRTFILAPALVFPFAHQLMAQDTAQLLNRMQAMEDRIKALEGELQVLKSQQAIAAATPPQPAPGAAIAAPAQQPQPQAAAAQAAAAQAAAAAVPQEGVTLGGAGAAAAKVLNPDISVIGDFIGAAGNGATRGAP